MDKRENAAGAVAVAVEVWQEGNVRVDGANDRRDGRNSVAHIVGRHENRVATVIKEVMLAAGAILRVPRQHRDRPRRPQLGRAGSALGRLGFGGPWAGIGT